VNVRAFLACRLPDDSARALSATLAPMITEFDGAAIRWVPVGNLHLTLRFFGTMDIAAATALKAQLTAVGANVAPVQGSIVCAKFLPSRRRARVLAFGVEGVDALAEVAARVDRLVGEARDHPFDAHVTVARLKRPGRVALERLMAAIDEIERADIAVTFDHMSLFRSDTVPDGARYTALYAIPFSRPAASDPPAIR